MLSHTIRRRTHHGHPRRQCPGRGSHPPGRHLRHGADHAACPDTHWPAAVQGMPTNLHAGARGGDYFWHDKNGWHLRVTHHGKRKVVFTGRIVSSTPITVTGVQAREERRVHAQRRQADADLPLPQLRARSTGWTSRPTARSSLRHLRLDGRQEAAGRADLARQATTSIRSRTRSSSSRSADSPRSSDLGAKAAVSPTAAFVIPRGSPHADAGPAVDVWHHGEHEGPAVPHGPPAPRVGGRRRPADDRARRATGLRAADRAPGATRVAGDVVQLPTLEVPRRRPRRGPHARPRPHRPDARCPRGRFDLEVDG